MKICIIYKICKIVDHLGLEIKTTYVETRFQTWPKSEPQQNEIPEMNDLH